jgi:hypothetical protein
MMQMPHLPNWRSSAKTDALYKLERPGFAWEFLRRNHHYRKAYAQWCRQHAPDAADSADTFARWGLSFRM